MDGIQVAIDGPKINPLTRRWALPSQEDFVTAPSFQ